MSTNARLRQACPATPAPGAGTVLRVSEPDVARRLAELTELRASGAIDDARFAREKARLLGSSAGEPTTIGPVVPVEPRTPSGPPAWSEPAPAPTSPGRFLRFSVVQASIAVAVVVAVLLLVVMLGA